jgi:8-oxo-dGTP diphosphatase
MEQGPRYAMPFTRLEIVCFAIVGGKLQVLLGKRAGPPFKGKWAIPGGVLRIDLDASLDQAAQRVASERLRIEAKGLRQLQAYGGATRDPRAPWTLSVIYRTLVQEIAFPAKEGKRLEALLWVPVEKAAADPSLAFDHQRLIATALANLRAEVNQLGLPFGLLPELFTLGELQACCEVVLGRAIDKSSFRRRIAERNLVSAAKGEYRTGPFRPALLHRLTEQPDGVYWS